MTSEPDLVARIRDVRRELARAGPPRVRQEGDFERVALPYEDGDVLRDLLVAEDAHVVIEIGLAYASSALAIAEAVASLSADTPRQVIVDAFVALAAFVDGSHVFHNVFVDLYFVRELVRPGGVVVLDDCDWPSVAAAVRYYELNCGWQPEPIDRPTRLRAYRLPKPRVELGFESFHPFGDEARQQPAVDR